MHKMQYLFLTLLILTFYHSPQIHSQELSSCDKVLEKEIRDSYNVQSLHLFEGYLREILNYSHEELRDYVSKKDGSISVPIRTPTT